MIALLNRLIRRYGGYVMAKLTTKKRNKLKPSTFGLPKEKKYPMPDKSHAGNAKARASQQYNKGKLSEAKKAKIDRKADKILDTKKKAVKKPVKKPSTRRKKK